jgi:hypothetical protein
LVVRNYLRGLFMAVIRRVGPDSQIQGGTETAGPSNLESTIFAVAEPSIREIEDLIARLQGVRDQLTSEARRVYREVTQFAQMTQAANESTKVIAGTLLQLKRRTARQQ